MPASIPAAAASRPKAWIATRAPAACAAATASASVSVGYVTASWGPKFGSSCVPSQPGQSANTLSHAAPARACASIAPLSSRAAVTTNG